MPFASAFPPISIPALSLWDFLFVSAKEEGFQEDKVIYRSATGSRQYSVGQVRNTAQTFGQYLQVQWHWQKGDVFAIFAQNDVDYMPCIYGAIYAGGVVSPANPYYTVNELAHMLRDCGAKAVAAHKSVLHTVVAAAAIVGLPTNRIVLIGGERDSSGQYIHFKELKIPGSSFSGQMAQAAPSDLAFLGYSSGTSGPPKGVMLSHRNIISNILQLKRCAGHNYTWQNDKILAVLPFFHIYGLTALLHQCLHRGIELVVMPSFDLEAFCETIEYHRITFIYVAPPILVQLSRSPKVSKYNLKSVRMMTSAAAPLTKELVIAVGERLGLKVSQAYGLSETSPASHLLPWENCLTHVGSVGKLISNMAQKFVAPESGQEVGIGELGEIWMKGPNVFEGYWKNPESTRNAFSDDGYFKTGDVGYVDANGYVYVTDRVKELIKYKGFQVAPAELEGLLLDCPLVQDVAVIGVVDAGQQTELPRAYIVPTDGMASESLAKQINDWLDPKVAYFKKLRGGIRFIDAVPKSQSGKILRRILKDQARNEAEGVKARL